MNVAALLAVLVFAGALLAIFGVLYAGAVRSYQRGQLGYDGVQILLWALLGQLCIFALLAITAFLT